MTGEVQRWADVAMYQAEPMPTDYAGVVRPRVHLQYMTPDPLRQLAGAAELYRGKTVYEWAKLDVDTAQLWLREMTKTKLGAPLEWIDIHLLFEGVTRAFTAQLERQRVGAVYIQESMRFAVKNNAEIEVAMPPSISKLDEDHPDRVIWMDALKVMGRAYNALVSDGIPAEDARGILPLNTTTRVHYKTNLRGLIEHSGMRLCSQAQYEWKEVWVQIVQEMMRYGPPQHRWQQRAIVSLFRPVCYMTGRCEFRAQSDRHCSIRDRVEEHFSRGEGPDQWHDIDPLEPLKEGAARLSPQVADYLKERNSGHQA